jgi:hypothetical protein
MRHQIANIEDNEGLGVQMRLIVSRSATATAWQLFGVILAPYITGAILTVDGGTMPDWAL